MYKTVTLAQDQVAFLECLLADVSAGGDIHQAVQKHYGTFCQSYFKDIYSDLQKAEWHNA